MFYSFATQLSSAVRCAVLIVVLCAFTTLSSHAQLVSNFSDVTYWVGSGANESVMIIDWNDGNQPASYIWGYRWDYDSSGNAPAGIDMLKDIAADDPRLLTVLLFGDTFVFGLGYDTNGNGSSFTFGTPGVGTETGSASDPADRYKEGFYENGFWSYSLYGGDIDYTIYDQNFNPIGTANYNQTGTTLWSVASSDWWFSQVGAADRELVPNSWDVWHWAPNFSPGAISQPVAAIPEPTSFALVAVCATGLILFRRARYGASKALFF